MPLADLNCHLYTHIPAISDDPFLLTIISVILTAVQKKQVGRSPCLYLRSKRFPKTLPKCFDFNTEALVELHRGGSTTSIPRERTIIGLEKVAMGRNHPQPFSQAEMQRVREWNNQEIDDGWDLKAGEVYTNPGRLFHEGDPHWHRWVTLASVDTEVEHYNSKKKKSLAVFDREHGLRWIHGVARGLRTPSHSRTIESLLMVGEISSFEHTAESRVTGAIKSHLGNHLCYIKDESTPNWSRQSSTTIAVLAWSWSALQIHLCAALPTMECSYPAASTEAQIPGT